MATIHEYNSVLFFGVQLKLNTRFFHRSKFQKHILTYSTNRNARRTFTTNKSNGIIFTQSENYWTTVRVSVGNRKKKRKFHLAAGEEELLAAVVPPGDDLAAVQADLQSKSGDPASDRQNPVKSTRNQAMRSRSIAQQDEEKADSQSVPARRLPWASGARRGRRRSSP